MSGSRALALRRALGSLALCAGAVVALSTASPYWVRTDVSVPAGGDGATFRVRDVLVVLPPPGTTVEPHRGIEPAPWGGAPVLTLVNEGREPVVLRTAGASVVLEGSAFREAQPREYAIGPGEKKSVRLELRRARLSGAEARPDALGRFFFGALVFPDGTSRAIEGELADLEPLPAIQDPLPGGENEPRIRFSAPR